MTKKTKYPDMIENIIILNEINKIWVSLEQGDINTFQLQIGDNNGNLTANNDDIYISKSDNKFFMKVAEENKNNLIEGLNNQQTVIQNNNGLENESTREHWRQERSTTQQQRLLCKI